MVVHRSPICLLGETSIPQKVRFYDHPAISAVVHLFSTSLYRQMINFPQKFGDRAWNRASHMIPSLGEFISVSIDFNFDGFLHVISHIVRMSKNKTLRASRRLRNWPGRSVIKLLVAVHFCLTFRLIRSWGGGLNAVRSDKPKSHFEFPFEGFSSQVNEN